MMDATLVLAIVGAAALFGAILFGLVSFARSRRLWELRLSLARWIVPESAAVLPMDPPLERLAKLRDSITSTWATGLVLGEGDYLSRVWIPQYLGLVDVASAAERLYEEPQNEEYRARLRRDLDDYLRDLETAKLRSRY